MKAKTTELRNGRQYRKMRANFIAKRKAVNAPCWLHAFGRCLLNGAPIDYHAKGRARNSPELDHRYPASTHPHMVRDPGNFEIAHACCNQSRGARHPMMYGESSSMHDAMHKTGDVCIKRWSPPEW